MKITAKIEERDSSPDAPRVAVEIFADGVRNFRDWLERKGAIAFVAEIDRLNKLDEQAEP